MEPDQGNGEMLLICYGKELLADVRAYSALPYHLPAEAGCGLESGCAADFYPGA